MFGFQVFWGNWLTLSYSSDIAFDTPVSFLPSMTTYGLLGVIGESGEILSLFLSAYNDILGEFSLGLPIETEASDADFSSFSFSYFSVLNESVEESTTSWFTRSLPNIAVKLTFFALAKFYFGRFGAWRTLSCLSRFSWVRWARLDVLTFFDDYVLVLDMFTRVNSFLSGFGFPPLLANSSVSFREVALDFSQAAYSFLFSVNFN